MSQKQELKDSSVEELNVKLDEFRQELFSLRNEKVANKKLENPSQLRKLRKNIARALTFINEKQRQV